MVDTKTQYHKIKKEVDEALINVLESSQFIGGKVVNDFAANLATYHGASPVSYTHLDVYKRQPHHNYPVPQAKVGEKRSGRLPLV